MILGKTEHYPLRRETTFLPGEHAALLEFETAETRRGKYHAAVYDGLVTFARVVWTWSQREERWDGSLVVYLQLLKPNGKCYTSGWRSGAISQSLKVDDPELPAWAAEIVEQTKPNTHVTVTITEEPLS